MKRTVGREFLGFAAMIALALFSGAALADQPHDWQMGLQQMVTPVGDRLASLHNLLLWIIGTITLFVAVLLLYVAIRFRASKNPVASKTSHNTLIEIAWTVIPILILVVIAFPSFKLLYFQERVPDSPLTLKVTGLQWYWHYSYPDNGDFGFDSYGIEDKDLKPGQERLLDVDNEVVLPVNTNVRVQIAGNDVMHSWFVPSLAVQKYAVVGRLNEVWLNVEKEGTYYGECNQICGVNHSYMPIKIHVVSKDEFQKWVETAKQKFAREDGAPPAVKLAAAQ
ncbi:cytochrome c oxidase subunit 2 [Aliidongia dinghuensis]|uniref:Cytochrome c oxidase subunit 2 n=1 Tax=Aliidongia dinghuensis TaxID=1867774 RepID=A0A8J2YTF0_9PROT|nr:cytochrome c oxidase subunit II [Aliidongia dinghuensis]GGF16311.1 cytochrome c oxidase subunit 2 [Aliidongia dinghuensis]